MIRLSSALLLSIVVCIITINYCSADKKSYFDLNDYRKQSISNRFSDDDYYDYKEDYALLGLKDPADEDKKYKNSRLMDTAIILGLLYFTYNIFRPEHFTLIGQNVIGNADINQDIWNLFFGQGRTYLTDIARKLEDGDDIMSEAFKLIINKAEPLDMGLNYLDITGNDCKKRMVCEARQMITKLPKVEAMAQTHGWMLGSSAAYKPALEDGRLNVDCSLKYNECPSTPLSKVYNIVHAIM